MTTRLDSRPSAGATHASSRPARRFSFAQPFVYLVALVVVGAALGPVLYVIMGGFRTTPELNADPAGLPSPGTLDNYANVLQSGAFWTQVGNSTLVSLATTAGVVLLGVMAAFVIARYQFRGRDALFSLFTAGLLFPLTVAILPLYLMLRSMGLAGSLLSVIIPQIAFALPVTIVILVPFLKAIPNELEEASFIDGTTRFGFFWRILLPLSGPGLVTVGVLAFVTSWNSYLLPLLMVGGDPSSFTLPLGVQVYSTQYSSDTAGVLAFTSLAMLPALVFFTLMERRIVSGLSGAVKG